MYFKRLLAVAAGSVLFLVPSTAASAGLIGNVTVTSPINVNVGSPDVNADVDVNSNDCNVNIGSSCEE